MLQYFPIKIIHLLDSKISNLINRLGDITNCFAMRNNALFTFTSWTMMDPCLSLARRVREEMTASFVTLR